MSLVGTRPPTVDEWEQYEHHHRGRLAIKPGLTGLWQVSGRSNITDFEEVVRLDVEYIQTWDIGLDIKIMVKTILNMFRGNRGRLKDGLRGRKRAGRRRKKNSCAPRFSLYQQPMHRC